MKFSAVMLFVALWVTCIYFPIAHMVWYWGGPDAWAGAAKALADAGGPDNAEAKAAFDLAMLDAGKVFQWGALDFAGGTVVHINAGIAGLVGALIIGKRVGYGREAMPPHSLTMTMIGAALLWVGWFGFNVGSNLESNGTAGLAMINTFVATAAAGLAWMLIEWIVKGKPSALGLASGIVAGLVAITPACGFAGPMGSIIFGLVAGVVCFFATQLLKRVLHIDDSLDVSPVHGVGGVAGTLLTGVFAATALGGAGFTVQPGIAAQLGVQALGIGATILWCGGITWVLLKVLDVALGLRVTEEQESEGLDLAAHGERGYSP
jgi:Amt family ammonium transporter